MGKVFQNVETKKIISIIVHYIRKVDFHIKSIVISEEDFLNFIDN